MQPINEKENFNFCCFPVKRPLLKRNYATIVPMDNIDSKKEQDIFDKYLLKIDLQNKWK